MPGKHRPTRRRLAPEPHRALIWARGTFLLACGMHAAEVPCPAEARGSRRTAHSAPHARATERDLAWLGLDWDGPPLVQSEGSDRFPCGDGRARAGVGSSTPACAPVDLAYARVHLNRACPELRYPGKPAVAASRHSRRPRGTGKRGPQIRRARRHSSGRGAFAPPLECDVEAEVGDFLIAKRDRLPAYSAPVTVDYAHQAVTEVPARRRLCCPARPPVAFAAPRLGLPHPLVSRASSLVDDPVAGWPSEQMISAWQPCAPREWIHAPSSAGRAKLGPISRGPYRGA